MNVVDLNGILSCLPKFRALNAKRIIVVSKAFCGTHLDGYSALCEFVEGTSVKGLTRANCHLRRHNADRFQLLNSLDVVVGIRHCVGDGG